MTASFSDSLTLGTRGSALALYQANTTEALLHHALPHLKITQSIIKTTGDRRTDVALADVAKAEGIFDKGVFIKELEQALDDHSIDVAVHSLKDMPTLLDERFALAAVLERAPIRDALVTRNGDTIETLPPGACVGTSSVRRAKQLSYLRPDVQIVDLRGNVPTRLEKIASQTTLDAILLAEAGLIRLGYLPAAPTSSQPEPILLTEGLYAHRLPEAEFYPAAGQGAIAMEVRANDTRAHSICQALNHPETWLRITAERHFLHLLNAGCHTPVGVYSWFEQSTLHMQARVFPEAGGSPLTAAASGTDPISTAQSLFSSLT